MIRIRYGGMVIECDTPEEAVRVIAGIRGLEGGKRGPGGLAEIIEGAGGSEGEPRRPTKEEWRMAELEAYRDTFTR